MIWPSISQKNFPLYKSSVTHFSYQKLYRLLKIPWLLYRPSAPLGLSDEYLLRPAGNYTLGRLRPAHSHPEHCKKKIEFLKINPASP